MTTLKGVSICGCLQNLCGCLPTDFCVCLALYLEYGVAHTLPNPSQSQKDLDEIGKEPQLCANFSTQVSIKELQDEVLLTTQTQS